MTNPIHLLRRRVPLPTGRRCVVLDLQCAACGAWVKPRHFRTPAMVCRTCHTVPASRTWIRPVTP